MTGGPAGSGLEQLATGILLPQEIEEPLGASPAQDFLELRPEVRDQAHSPLSTGARSLVRLED